MYVEKYKTIRKEYTGSIEMKELMEEFIGYLHSKKNVSYNTEISYQRDLKKLEEYFEKKKIGRWEDVSETDIQNYLSKMREENFASATISRNIATIRAFFQYLLRQGIIAEDPSENLKPPKVEKKLPQTLTVQEVDRLLGMPDQSTAKGLRDRAMLELLYATGMRVSELIHLKVSDLNLQMGYVICHDANKERIIPIGNVSRDILATYVEKVRDFFLKNKKETALFTNCQGRVMSRQGFWKILKGYAAAAGIQCDITPHTLRHSFAVHMLQNGADVKSVQEMLGHSDISSTQMYLGVNAVKMRDVYMKAHPRR